MTRHWTTQALCANANQAIFYPEHGETYDEAKVICAECPVQTECLDYAIQRGERHGMWGGMAPRDRTRIRRSSPSDAARLIEQHETRLADLAAPTEAEDDRTCGNGHPLTEDNRAGYGKTSGGSQRFLCLTCGSTASFADTTAA